jgi:hypothetical protein
MVLITVPYSEVSWGRDMAEFIWHWTTSSNNRVYTRQADVAEQAMKKGFLVIGTRPRPRVFRG